MIARREGSCPFMTHVVNYKDLKEIVTFNLNKF
jgi:hypothetical protein